MAPLFEGSVVNVSGWRDSDKQGRKYQDYFSNATSYHITNYSGERGYQGVEGEIRLDLTGELPQELHQRFDVVFCHTVLEHIFDVGKAFENLCDMSKDVAVVILPFAQKQHETPGSYMDYWRFSPSCLRELYAKHGMATVYESVSPQKNSAVYVLAIGSRHPQRWRDKLPEYQAVGNAAWWIGANGIMHLKRWCLKYIGWWPGKPLADVYPDDWSPPSPTSGPQ